MAVSGPRRNRCGHDFRQVLRPYVHDKTAAIIKLLVRSLKKLERTKTAWRLRLRVWLRRRENIDEDEGETPRSMLFQRRSAIGNCELERRTGKQAEAWRSTNHICIQVDRLNPNVEDMEKPHWKCSSTVTDVEHLRLTGRRAEIRKRSSGHYSEKRIGQVNARFIEKAAVCVAHVKA
jgi:hypothetical protein